MEPTEKISKSLYALVAAAGLGREPPTPSVFHYTSPTGLIGIIESGRIIATDIRFFNDRSEYTFAFELIREPLKALDTAGLTDVRCYIESEFARQANYEIFVSCFCEADDLVPQWRGYGADGAGYAVGFPKSDLSHEGRTLLLGVLYGEAKVVEAARKAIARALEMFQKGEGDGATVAERREDVITSLMVALFLTVVAGKDEIFEYEREYRLVHLVPRSALETSNPIEFRPRNGLVVPYVTLPLPRTPADKLSLSSVRYGPSLSDTATEVGVRLLLEKHQLGDVPICRSKAPLRAAW